MPFSVVRYQDEAPQLAGASAIFGGASDRGQPRLGIEIRAHNSLTPPGFVTFISITALLSLVPLMSVLGTPVLWGLLPFVLAMLSLIWLALKRSWRDGNLSEQFLIWDDHVELTHRPARGAPLTWAANPYWVRLELHRRGGRVPDYVTLANQDRMVEIGSFLSHPERLELHDLLARELRPA